MIIIQDIIIILIANYKFTGKATDQLGSKVLFR